MAHEVRHYTLTIPAGTPNTAPVSQSMRMPPRIVDALEIIVPPGGAGLIGFRVTISGIPVIPYQSDAWIVTADDKIKWELEDYPDSGDWAIEGYNSGTVDHAVYVRPLVRVPQLVASDVAKIANVSGLSPDDEVDSLGPLLSEGQIP